MTRLDSTKFALAALMGLFTSPAWAADPPAAAPGKVSFHRQVRPLLQEHCQGCHQPAKPGGGVVLTGFAGLFKEGDSAEPSVVAAKPDESLLIKEITPNKEGKASMPKDKPALKPAQIEMLRQWIAEGAVDDSPAMSHPLVDQDHPPVYAQLPIVTSLDFSPDGQWLAVSGYHEVLLHKADGSGIAARLVGLSERIESAIFSPDGKLLAVTGGSPSRFGEVQIWDVAEKKLKVSASVTFDTVYGASWSPDGTKIGFGCADNTFRAIDAATGKEVLYQGAHNDWVHDTVFSVKGTHIISVSRDMSMKLTEVATQRFEDNITSITPGALKGGLLSVDRHPQKDELLIGGSDGTPKIYKMFRTQARQIGDDFNFIRKFEALPGRVFSVEYSPDGAKIAAGSSSDGTGQVRIFEEATAKPVATCAGQKGAVYCVTWSHDGKLVAAAGFDGQVRYFDAQSGALVKEFPAAPVQPAVAGK